MGLPLWSRGSTAGGIGLVPGCRTEILAKKKNKKKVWSLARKRGSRSSDDLVMMTKEKKKRMTKGKKQRIKELFCVLMN